MIFKKLHILVHFASWFLYVKCAEFEVGNAIDLLNHYGIVHEMLPIGSEDPDKFLEKAFSVNLFKKDTIAAKKKIHQGEWSNGIWKMTMSDRMSNLVDCFFDNYEIEHVEKPGKLFFSTWRYKDLQLLFGVPQFYLMNDYLYLLIRQEKCVNYVTLKSLPENETMLNSDFVRELQNLTADSTMEVAEFMAEFGSHFTRSFTIGDVIFQVLVYPRGALECFKINKYNHITQVLPKCATSSVIHAGKIRTFSNTPEMDKELNANYNKNSTTSIYHNLLELKINKKPIPENICKASNLAIIGFNLSGINHVIFNQNKSLGVKEMMLNQMGIRDVYL